MKYFIDLEATQFNHEIISIGCVREDGEKYYSLVRPKNMSTVTNFITNLTGISKEMLKEARRSDDVFEEFYSWISKINEPAEFFCYGDVDDDFLRKNLMDRTNSLKAQASISLILTNLTDYSKVVKKHFELSKSIALKKVMNYYYPNDEHVSHNALSDAEMLYYIYKSVENETEVKGVPFPDYIDIPIFKNENDFKNFQIDRLNNSDVCKETYNTLNDAVDYIMTLMKKQGDCQCKSNNVARRIMNAINNKQKYFGFKWVVHVKRDLIENGANNYENK